MRDYPISNLSISKKKHLPDTNNPGRQLVAEFLGSLWHGWALDKDDIEPCPGVLATAVTERQLSVRIPR
ncbi:MAG: hypothetical protein GY796_23245 [Chloroflexi bacterium]|nr:hypothetical protein [Chloroflexota bacterium]